MHLKSVAASHAAGKGAEPDAVFAVAGKAQEAIRLYGQDQVIDATLGALYDEDGKFAILPVVDEHYRQISAEELMSYAPIAGIPDFLRESIHFVFSEGLPAGMFAAALATPGGTGAIRNIVFNYVEQGETYLIPDWHWAPYETIAEEHGRKFDVYELFDQDLKFNIDSLRQKTLQYLKTQDLLTVMFNTPAHNPTGFSLSYEDWQGVMAFFKETAQNENKRIVIALDISYIDYVDEKDKPKAFFQLFAHLPENIFVALAFSMSKAFMVYGMRSGSLIGLSASQEIIQDFSNINAFSGRGVWSNGARGAQRLLVDVMQNPALKARAQAERQAYNRLLLDRAAIFIQEAKESGLLVLPYHGGFFFAIPVPDASDAVSRLMEARVFTVALPGCVRVAVCALPKRKVYGLAQKIKRILSA
jgi:aromatic-amino-acid transaminase